MSTQQPQQPQQAPQQPTAAIGSESPPPATPLVPAPAPASGPPPQGSSSQPSRQTGHAIFYVFGQVVLLGMALISAKNFQVALGWVVLSLAFTQVMADFVEFTRPNLKKRVVGACTIIPGLIALLSSYIG